MFAHNRTRRLRGALHSQSCALANHSVSASLLHLLRRGDKRPEKDLTRSSAAASPGCALTRECAIHWPALHIHRDADGNNGLAATFSSKSVLAT